MKRSPRIILMAATGGYAGYLPVVPGTFGTMAGLLPAYFLFRLQNDVVALIAIVLFILVAVRIAGRAEKEIGAADPGCIVIDEIAGIMVTLWSLPFTWLPVTAGFLIFRCLDMIKPFPIRQIERKLSGGTGIVADDIVAGVIAHVLLRIVLAVAR